LAAAVAAMYVPVVVATYGFADDYPILRDAAGGDWSWITHADLGNGRPGMLAMHVLGFGLLDGVGSLRWLRLFAVLGIALVAVDAAQLCVAASRRRWTGCAFGLAVAALPAMQVVAGWATLSPVPLAMLAAMWAAWRAQTSTRPGHLVAPAAALVCAALVYQPAAMAYWLPVAILATGPARTPVRVRPHVLVLAAGAVAALAAWLVGLPWQDNAVRGHLSLAVLDTGRWFATGPLPRALVPASLHPSGWVAVAVLALLVAGLVRAEGGRRAVLLLLLVPAAYAPNLATGSEGNVSARSTVALAPVVLVLMLRAAEGLLPARAPRLVVTGLAGAVLTVLAVEACAVTWVFIARPAAVEWDATLDGTVGVAPAERIAVVPSRWSALVDAGIVPSNSHDEYGLASSWYGFAAVPMVKLAVREHTGRWPAGANLVRRGAPTHGQHVVDFGRLLAARH
jgi:hypothetical protein